MTIMHTVPSVSFLLYPKQFPLLVPVFGESFAVDEIVYCGSLWSVPNIIF